MDLTIASRVADTPVGSQLQLLEADIQGCLDSGNDRRLQTGVLWCLPAQASPSGSHEQAVIPNFG